MARILGVDVGYGFVKVTDGTYGYSFPSVVGEGHTKPTFSVKSTPVPVADNIKIQMNQKLFHVGKSAIRHSKYVYRDLSYTRSVGEDFEILFCAALSLFCKDYTNDFKVVTGLPVERIQLAGDLEQRIRGEKDIKIFRNGKTHSTRIYVPEVQIVPQPLGTYWSQFFNSEEQTNASLKGLTGVIDVGFRTTDLAAIEDEEYIPEKSKSLPIGLATAYSTIGSKLATEYGLEKESYALDSIIIQRQIDISGKTFDISDIVTNAFEKLALNILVETSSHWRIADFNSLIITGGGGQAIGVYLLPQLTQAIIVPEPITANCCGYLDWGNWLWQEPCTPQTSPVREQIEQTPETECIIEG